MPHKPLLDEIAKLKRRIQVIESKQIANKRRQSTSEYVSGSDANTNLDRNIQEDVGNGLVMGFAFPFPVEDAADLGYPGIIDTDL